MRVYRIYYRYDFAITNFVLKYDFYNAEVARIEAFCYNKFCIEISDINHYNYFL